MEKKKNETSGSNNENSDSGLEESNNNHIQSINRKKYVHHHNQKVLLSKSSYSSESLLSDSDDNDSKDKPYKQLKTHVTGTTHRTHKPSQRKKSTKRNSTKYSTPINKKDYHNHELDSSDTNKDARSYQHTSKKALINNKQNNSQLNSKSLINTLSMCPRFSESLLNLAEYEDILPKYVREVVSNNPHIFTLSDNIVILNPKISICKQYLNHGCSKQSICHDLHICHQFIINNCQDSKCILGHNLTSNHNHKVIKHFKIHKLRKEILLNILKTQTSSDKPLKVCIKYNLGRCKNLRCDSLHVCLDLVQNNYRCKLNNCNLNHNLLDDTCLELLGAAGISTNEAPRDVLTALWESNPSICETSSEDCEQEASKESPVQQKYRNKTPLNSQKIDDSNANSVPTTQQELKNDSVNQKGTNNKTVNSLEIDDSNANTNLDRVTSNDSMEDSDQQESKENYVHQKNRNKDTENLIEFKNSVTNSEITKLPNTNSESETSNDSLGNRDSHNESVNISDSETESFQWQISSDGSQWANLYHSQTVRIEQSFCDPKIETITLSKLICPNIKSDRSDVDFLMGNNFWEANFQSMLLLKDDQSEILYLRRENVDLQPSQSHERIIFLWCFEDCDGKWLECSRDSDRENKLYIFVSSNEIEQAYLNDSNIPLTLGNQYVSYILDFDSMTLLNLQNNNKINVRRRPKPHLKNSTGFGQEEMDVLFDMDHNSSGNHNDFSLLSNVNEINISDNEVSENPANIDSQTYAAISQKYTVWSHNPDGYVDIPEICYDSVESICKNELGGCKRLHAKLHFHWQVSEDGEQWLNMHSAHVLSLERSFCNPVNDEVSIPSLDQASLNYEESGSLIALGTETWKANFQSMLLLNKTQTRILYLRRLTTESIAGKVIEANSYSWYIKHVDENWVKLEKDSINGLSIDISSAAIEGNFQHDSSSSMTLGNSSWILDFEPMTLSNNETDIHYDVKRRPKPHLKVSEEDINLNEEQEVEGQSQSLSHSISRISLPNTWDAMLPGEKSCRIPLSQLSTEFATVQDLLPDSLQTKVTNIERIQNPFLWYAFQNKRREMSTTYEGDESTVNIMQLFHGTKPEVIGNICIENLDWRLHGSTTGQVYGRGTYFSTDATISYRYCTSDSSGKQYLLLAQVAVGTVTLGDSTMVRPPLNAETGLPYDSTVNTLPNPTIIVKYDKQEYFPEYIISIE